MGQYRFEWNFAVSNQEEFEQFVEDMKKEVNPYLRYPMNYEQLARLWYQGEMDCVMIELQVPTAEQFKLTEDDTEQPWLDGFEVDNLDHYDASHYLDEQRTELNYDNVKQKMLEFAQWLCMEEMEDAEEILPVC